MKCGRCGSLNDVDIHSLPRCAFVQQASEDLRCKGIQTDKHGGEMWGFF